MKQIEWQPTIYASLLFPFIAIIFWRWSLNVCACLHRINLHVKAKSCYSLRQSQSKKGASWELCKKDDCLTCGAQESWTTIEKQNLRQTGYQTSKTLIAPMQMALQLYFILAIKCKFKSTPHSTLSFLVRFLWCGYKDQETLWKQSRGKKLFPDIQTAKATTGQV